MHAALLSIAFISLSALAGITNADKQKYEGYLETGDSKEIEAAKDWFAKAEQASGPSLSAYWRWKRAWCDFKLSQHAVAEESLAKLVADYPNDGLMVLVHRDLGKFYLLDWNLEKALAQLQEADRICERDKGKYQVAGTWHDIGDPGVFHIRSMLANCRVMLGNKKDDGKRELEKLQTELIGRVNIPKDEHHEEYVCLLSASEIHLAELARRDKDTYTAMSILRGCLARLNTNESGKTVEWQIHCADHLAYHYGQLARFDDGRKVLDDADALLKRYRGKIGDTDWNTLDSECANAVAMLDIEQSICVFEQDPLSADIGRLLSDADHAAATASADWPGSNRVEVAIANIENSQAMAQEMRGRVCEAKRQDATEAFGNAKRLEDESIVHWAGLPRQHDILLEMRLRRARTLASLGDRASIEQARTEAKDVLKIYEENKDYGPDSLPAWLCHEVLIEIEESAGNRSEAMKHAEAHRRLAATNLPSYAAGLTATEQLTFFRRRDDAGLQAALWLGIANRSDSAIAAHSAEWLLNGKAKAPEILAIATQRARSTPGFSEFVELVQEQSYALFGPASKNRQQTLLELESKKRNLAGSRSSSGIPYYSIGELCKSLRADEVFIDISSVWNRARSKRSYVAWVVNSTGDVKIVGLGGADEIDHAMNELSHEMNQFGVRRRGLELEPLHEARGDPSSAEERIRSNLLGPLGNQILLPLREAAANRTDWIISPDGSLIDMPWSALIWPGTSDYALDHVTFRTVISGRDILARNEASSREPGQPLILANPDYGDDVRGGPAVPGVLGRFQRLPATEEEGRAIKGALELVGLRPDLRLDGKATKRALLQSTPPPRILYLATHGFFIPEKAAEVQDPFLRCGVALAGCNVVGNSNQNLPGILTAAEMLTVNLHGTDLVVLSTCQSGSGLTTNGQSGTSFRHACHLAGARAVVASLWSVDDLATKELMVEFTKEMGKPPWVSKVQALRSAQHRLMASPKTKHPFFWAAFILSGF